jgi:myosin heavy subunit
MAAASVIAAAADQRELCWLRTGKVAKKPKLDDPLQLFALVEVIRTLPSGRKVCKVEKAYWDEPVNFLPQGGGCAAGEELEVIEKELLKANPPSQDMVPDLTALENLNEAALLHTIGMRYCGGSKLKSEVESHYCTFIGQICVATNPFAPQKAWRNTFNIEDYLGSKDPVITNKKLQPHPWSVADMAYRELLEEGKNQAVLICGESGAGKTECCKFVLAYLIAKKESTVENLAEKLMATNDPLEAFGNAKTVNNDNSSRFAKCMQIFFDTEGRVIGSEVQTSLLEKGRSCAFFQQERNFHIFYMLCYYRHEPCSADPGEDQDTDTSDALDMLGEKAHKYLKEAKDYDFIAPGAVEIDTEGQKYSERFRATDIDWFKRVIKSFRTSLGYQKKDTDEMMALLTGILHLGQLKFTDEDEAKVEGESKPDLAAVADCLGMDAAAFETELTLERIEMGGSLIPKTLNKRKAMGSRDAICKSLFQTIFLDIVEMCNESVSGDKERAKGRVGVLDIFGFERMQFNSLEQLCINYTNEKLHQTFIDQVFEGEKKVYREEGLDDSAINFTDNAMVLEMVAGHNPHDKKKGLAKTEITKKVKVSLVGILDNTCKMETNDGTNYCEAVDKQWRGKKDANGPLFEGPRFGAEEFTVVHFAGPVKYGTTEVDKVKFLPPSQWEKAGIDPLCPQIDSFVTKNKDKVPQSLLDHLTEHVTNDYFKRIDAKRIAREKEADRASAAEGSTPGRSGAAKTIVSKFNREIEAFFQQLLTGADPKFIRTINPRPKGIPAPPTMGERFNLQRVLGQLKYTGILDTVRVRASGYIIRKRYEEFAHGYVYPCNLLEEDGGHALQAGLENEQFAEKLKKDPELSKEVIRALFGMAEYAVNVKGELLEGKTMVFIKKLSTIEKLNAKKEKMMEEIVLIMQAKVNMAALALRWYRHTQAQPCTRIATTSFCGATLAAKQAAATKLQRSYRTWLAIYGRGKHPGVRGAKSLWSRKGAWVSIISLKKEFGDAMPLAEAWGLGYLQRRKGGPFARLKAQAIEDGSYAGGGMGQGLLGQSRRRRQQNRNAAKNTAGTGEFDRVFGGVATKTEAGAVRMGKSVPQLRQALATATLEAGRACERTTDESKLAMLTREYLAADNLQFQLSRTIKALHEERPGRDELQVFLLANLRGQEYTLKGPRESETEGNHVSDYIARNGGFALLKPALFAVAKHRPHDAAAYIATFISVAINLLSS